MHDNAGMKVWQDKFKGYWRGRNFQEHYKFVTAWLLLPVVTKMAVP